MGIFLTGKFTELETSNLSLSVDLTILTNLEKTIISTL